MTAATPSRRRVLAVSWKDLDKWVIPVGLLRVGKLPTDWKIVRMRDIVRQVNNRVRTDATREYKMAGVRWYGEGVFHRETVRGEFLSAAHVAPLVPCALIFNRLFAWKGSFAVVPPSLADCFVSGEFPQFLANPSYVLPEYVYLFCLRDATIRAVDAASTGTAAVSRNRFKEEAFLSLEMPLPPLQAQASVVRRWLDSRSESATARERAGELEAAVERRFFEDLGITIPPITMRPRCFAVAWTELVRFSCSSTVDKMLGLDKRLESTFPYAALGDISTVSYGIQKSPSNRPGRSARPYLSVANVQKGFLDLADVKTINVPESELPSYRLEPGDILFVEGNGSRAELGRVAMWSGEIENCVHQNHLIRVRVDQARLLPEFAVNWFNTDVGRGHFFRAAKTSSGLGTINSSEVRAAPVPLPPLPVQREIVARVEAGRREVMRERESGRRVEADTNATLEEAMFAQSPVR
jgi:type I restriction enzyme, S subunit